MAKTLIFYDADGRITGAQMGLDAQDIAEYRERGVAFALSDDATIDPDTHYIADGEVAERPVLEAQISSQTIRADDLDEAIITGLPSPCVVTIDGEAHEVRGGRLVLTSAVPASYEIAVEHWPYRDWGVCVDSKPTK